MIVDVICTLLMILGGIMLLCGAMLAFLILLDFLDKLEKKRNDTLR